MLHLMWIEPIHVFVALRISAFSLEDCFREAFYLILQQTNHNLKTREFYLQYKNCSFFPAALKRLC